MFKNPWAGLVTLALVGTVGCTAAAPKFAFTHAEKRGKLANGLRFVIMPDASTQLAEVDVRYDVGSREDPPGKAGIAHVVEHLMFQLRPDGAGTTPLMQTINTLTTFFNAYTSWDQTHYQNTARAELVGDLLKIEAMRMYYGCQTISNDEFLREREVVRNEIRQRGGTAEGQIPQLILSAVYPKGHAYERMTGGDDNQLTSITLEDACTFMKNYYAPERATLVIAGGVDVDTTVAEIEKWFQKIPKRAAAPRAPVAAVVPAHKRVEFDLDVERASVSIAFPLPPSNTPEGEAAQFGIQSAWGRIAREGRQYGFAYDVGASVLGGALAPVWVLTIELKGLGKLDEALAFAKTAASQAYRGFDEGSYEQIEEFKNQRKAAFIESLEPLMARTEAVASMIQFSTDIDFESKDLYLFHELDTIGKFDGAKVAAAVKKYINIDNATIVVIKPNAAGVKGDKRSNVKFEMKSDGDKEVLDVDPSEAHRPFKVQGQLKSLDAVETVTLDNGMTVVMLPVKSMPLVSARLVFNNVGNATLPDNPALPGAAAQYLSLPAEADAFQRTGISVRCQAGNDTTVCATSGINIYLDVMVKGLERLIKAGTYSQEQIEGEQKSFRESMKTHAAQEQVEIDRQYLTALYGANHPYTKAGVDSVEAMNKISHDSLESFRNTHYTAANATLIIVGDFEPKQAEKLARDTFGGWSRGKQDKAIDPTVAPRTGPQVVGVVTKEEPQVEVRIAYPAPAGLDGQEGARQVLAGMMQYRVDEVRFKLGSTYGMYAARRATKGPTAYQIAGGGIDAPRAGESLKAIRDGLDLLRNGTTFDEDFVRSRRKVVSRLLGESTMTAELAQRLTQMTTFGLDKKFYNRMLQLVAATSPAQIHALIKAELDPKNEVIIVKGSRAQLDKTFADAGLTDVKIVEPDYK